MDVIEALPLDCPTNPQKHVRFEPAIPLPGFTLQQETKDTRAGLCEVAKDHKTLVPSLLLPPGS